MKQGKAIRFIRKLHRNDKHKTIEVNPDSGHIRVVTAGFTHHYNFKNGVLTSNGYTYTEEEIDNLLNL